MSKSLLCECGHTKSSHSVTQKHKKKFNGKCDDFDCSCNQFKFKEAKEITNHSTNYQTLIENNSYEPLTKPPKPKGNLISECDENGFARCFIVKCKNCKKEMTPSQFISHKPRCKQKVFA